MQYCSRCGSGLGTDGLCPSCQTQPIVQQDQLPAQQPLLRAHVEKSTGARFFCEYILGIIPIALIALTALVLLAGSKTVPFSHMWKPFICLVPFGLGVALTVKARGLDLSLIYVLGFSGILYALTNSIAITVFCAILIGAFNGALVVYLKLPAALSTLAVGQFVYVVTGVLSGWNILKLQTDMEISIAIVTLLALLLFAGAFVYHMLTCLGRPAELRSKSTSDRLSEFFAYPAAAACAAVTGVLQVLRMHAASPVSGGYIYFAYVLIIWATLHASKWFSNKYTSIICAVIVLFLLQLIQFSLTILNIESNILAVFFAIVTLPVMIAAGFAKWPFGKEKEHGITQ